MECLKLMLLFALIGTVSNVPKQQNIRQEMCGTTASTLIYDESNDENIESKSETVVICGVDTGIKRGSCMEFTNFHGATDLYFGYYYDGVYLGGTQCYGFAQWCQYKMFGKMSGKSNWDEEYIENSDNDFYNLTVNGISSIPRNSDVQMKKYLKMLISGAEAGAHLRTYPIPAESVGHSLIITDITEDGFSIAQCNGIYNDEYEGYKNCYVGTHTFTWDEYIESDYGKMGISYIEMPYDYPY